MADLINGFQHHTIDSKGTVVNLKTGNVKSHWLGANGYYHVDIQEFGRPKKVALHRLLALQYIKNPENKRTVNHKDGDKLNNNLSNLEWATYQENTKHAYDTNLQPYRRNCTLVEYDTLLKNRFLKGESLTDISKEVNQSLTRLSYNLRESAERLHLLEKYELELVNQKSKRSKVNGINRRNLINLQMLDKHTNEVVKVFNSIAEAKEYLNKKSSGPISNVLSGRQKSAYGYNWIKL